MLSHAITHFCMLSHSGTDFCMLSHSGTEFCMLSHSGTDFCMLSHEPVNFYQRILILFSVIFSNFSLKISITYVQIICQFPQKSKLNLHFSDFIDSYVEKLIKRNLLRFIASDEKTQREKNHQKHEVATASEIIIRWPLRREKRAATHACGLKNLFIRRLISCAN